MSFKKVALTAAVAFAAACSGDHSPTQPTAPAQPDQFDQNIGMEFATAGCSKDSVNLALYYDVYPSITDAQRLNRPLPFSAADSAIVQNEADSLTARLARVTVAADLTDSGPSQSFLDAFNKNDSVFVANVEKRTGGLTAIIGGGGYDLPTGTCVPHNAGASLTSADHAEGKHVAFKTGAKLGG